MRACSSGRNNPDNFFSVLLTIAVDSNKQKAVPNLAYGLPPFFAINHAIPNELGQRIREDLLRQGKAYFVFGLVAAILLLIPLKTHVQMYARKCAKSIQE